MIVWAHQDLQRSPVGECLYQVSSSPPARVGTFTPAKGKLTDAFFVAWNFDLTDPRGQEGAARDAGRARRFARREAGQAPV
jgi:hypothetical protein